MPAKTEKQARFMRWMAHDPQARKKHHISKKVAEEFSHTSSQKKKGKKK